MKYENEVVKNKNEEIVYGVYMKLIKKCVLENIGGFYNEEMIDKVLYDKIRKIDFREVGSYYGDTVLNDGVLSLPSSFFCVDLDKILDIDNNLEIKNLLAIYGVYAVFVNEFDSEEDKVIKNLIATYLVVKNNNYQLEKVEFAGRWFNSYNISNNILVNIIEEIATVLGEEVLIDTLKNNCRCIVDEIDTKTKRRGLGIRIVRDIVELDNLYKYIVLYSKVIDFNSELIEKKLVPIYEFLRKNKSSINYQNTILNLIEMRDFDISILGGLNKNKIVFELEDFTENEKKVIKNFVSAFDAKGYNRREDVLFFKYPDISNCCVRVAGKNYYGNEYFSFINKFITVFNDINQEYYSFVNLLFDYWESLSEVLLWQLASRYIRYNKEADIDLEKLWVLSGYNMSDYQYDLSDKKSTKLLVRKINLDKNMKLKDSELYNSYLFRRKDD